MKLPPLFFALTLLTVSPSAWAQDAPAAPPATPPALANDAAPPAGYVDFNAGQTVFDDQKGIGVYTEDVTATQVGENFILYAQKVVSSREQNTATATKDLRIETRESTIRGEKLFANFNTKVFSITGSVVVSSYGEGDGVQTAGAAKRRADEKRKPVRIACQRLDWNYDTRQATLVGNIRIVSGDSVGTCNQIIYDEPQNAAQLIGEVRFGNSKKQTFLADQLTLFIDSSLVQTLGGGRAIGPVNNTDDAPPAPKATVEFPKPATLPDADALPTPPADIDKFLPKAQTKNFKAAPAPAKEPAEPAPGAAPATEPAPAEPAEK